MVNILLNHITKTYPPNIHAVRNIYLQVFAREFLVVIGKSGSGKSTLLHLIAGLDAPTAGNIFFDEHNVTRLPPQQRGIGMVFQDHSLYPHMSVYQILGFGLRKVLPRAEMDHHIRKIAARLNITELLERKPKALSAGQAQRVALGHALVKNPGLLLLDEPLCGLDTELKADMRTLIRELHNESGATTLYVTHDQTEAMTLADRIVVLEAGKICHVGSPQQTYVRPTDVCAASLIGEPRINLFNGKVMVGRFHFDDDHPPSPALSSLSNVSHGQRIIAGLRPEHVRIEPSDSCSSSHVDSHFKGVVSLTEHVGAFHIVHISSGMSTLRAIARNGWFHPGTEVMIDFDWRNALFFFMDGRALNAGYN